MGLKWEKSFQSLASLYHTETLVLFSILFPPVATSLPLIAFIEALRKSTTLRVSMMATGGFNIFTASEVKSSVVVVESHLHHIL